MTALVLCEVEQGVTRLSLNDPSSRNSLSLDMIETLRDKLRKVETHVAVLAANGPGFCSGHNLKEITAHRQDNDLGQKFFDKLFDACAELMMDILQHPAAIIAKWTDLPALQAVRLWLHAILQ